MEFFLGLYTREQIEAKSPQERIAKIREMLSAPDYYKPILIHLLRWGENYPLSAEDGWIRGVNLITQYFTDGLAYLSS